MLNPTIFLLTAALLVVPPAGTTGTESVTQISSVEVLANLVAMNASALPGVPIPGCPHCVAEPNSHEEFECNDIEGVTISLHLVNVDDGDCRPPETSCNIQDCKWKFKIKIVNTNANSVTLEIFWGGISIGTAWCGANSTCYSAEKEKECKCDDTADHECELKVELSSDTGQTATNTMLCKKCV